MLYNIGHWEENCSVKFPCHPSGTFFYTFLYKLFISQDLKSQLGPSLTFFSLKKSFIFGFHLTSKEMKRLDIFSLQVLCQWQRDVFDDGNYLEPSQIFFEAMKSANAATCPGVKARPF